MPDQFSLSSEDWLIKEKGFHKPKQGMYESLFTLGNGYLGVRGSLEENPHESYRGTYIAGIFDKAEGHVRELVKAPGWVDFSIWTDDQNFSVDKCRVLSHQRTLDLRKGILHRVSRLKSPKGKIIKIETRRLVFAHQVRGAVLDVVVTAENFSGPLRIYSGLNGDVTNLGYFPRERVKHLNLVKMNSDEDHIYLEMETRDDQVKIAMAASTEFKNAPADSYRVSRIYGEKLAHVITFNAQKGKKYHFTKLVSIFTSREGYEKQLESAATDLLHDMLYAGLDYHLKQHIEEREKLWKTADVVIKGDQKAQKGIRFNLYHLIIAKPHHDSTVSIGAKFLTGEGYKGHAFWDTEIFVLPFYIYNFPDEARNLLMYRYYTLPGALQNAKDMEYSGAKYAWESADSGIETTPNYGLREDGSKSKIFTGEEEHHIVADVAYGVYKYVEATGDIEFLQKYGAEILLQTARFWLSRVERRRDRYEIRKVIGPDEFHEHVDNNAFTNYLATWNIAYALEIHAQMKKTAPKMLSELLKRIKLKQDEIDKMKVVAKTLYFPYDQKTELIEEFEGYFSLDDYKIKKHDVHGMPLYPKGVTETNLENTQLVKQADVVLLLHLFLDRFPPELKEKNYDYYEARTMHKSSLSPCIYALMGLEVGNHKHAYNYLIKTSYIDLVDANKNTADGIHAAAAGGAWMAAVHGFAGMRVRRGVLSFDPWLPGKWQELVYTCVWQESLLRVKITHRGISFQILEGKSVTVNVQGKTVRIKPKQSKKIRLKKN